MYHYVSRDHVLERRGSLDAEWMVNGLLDWPDVDSPGARRGSTVSAPSATASTTSAMPMACVRYAAATLGWSARLLEQPSDDEVSALLGLDHADAFAKIDPLDREHPDLLMLVSVRHRCRKCVNCRRCEIWSGTANAAQSEPRPLGSDRRRGRRDAQTADRCRSGVHAGRAAAVVERRLDPRGDADPPAAQLSGTGRQDRHRPPDVLPHDRPPVAASRRAAVGRAAVGAARSCSNYRSSRAGTQSRALYFLETPMRPF